MHFAETYEDVYRVAFECDDDVAAEKVVHSEQRLAESAAAA